VNNVDIRLKLPYFPRFRYFVTSFYGLYKYKSTSIYGNPTVLDLSCPTVSDRRKQVVWGHFATRKEKKLLLIEVVDVEAFL
jgi:hypothetical protein